MLLVVEYNNMVPQNWEIKLFDDAAFQDTSKAH